MEQRKKSLLFATEYQSKPSLECHRQVFTNGAVNKKKSLVFYGGNESFLNSSICLLANVKRPKLLHIVCIIYCLGIRSNHQQQWSFLPYLISPFSSRTFANTITFRDSTLSITFPDHHRSRPASRTLEKFFQFLSKNFNLKIYQISYQILFFFSVFHLKVS